MAVGQNDTPIITYDGNDSVKDFAVPFPTFEAESLITYVRYMGTDQNIIDIIPDYDLEGFPMIPLLEYFDFEYSKLGIQKVDAIISLEFNNQLWVTDPDGFLKEDWTIVCRFTSDAFQPARLRSGLDPSTVEKALDRLAMVIKALKNRQLNVEAEFNALKDFIVDEGGSLPVGGVAGDYLIKNGPDNGDADWRSFTLSGYSSRFNQQFDASSIHDAIDKIVAITYTPPTVGLSASGNTLREKGTPVTSTTLSANVTKRSDNIAKIEFFQGAVSLDVMEPPANIGTGITPYAWTGSFSDNTTFRVEVTDDGNSGGPTTVSASTTFSFVYPYYYGARPPAASGTQISALTKDVIPSTANVTRTFTASGGDVFYFAYPNSYPALSSILDQNGFETIGSWTARTVTITGLDATAQTYRVYEYNNVQAATTADFTFRR